MTKLLIKTSDGSIYKSNQPLHFMVALEYGIDLEDVVAVGFVTKDREIWDERKPH